MVNKEILIIITTIVLAFSLAVGWSTHFEQSTTGITGAAVGLPDKGVEEISDDESLEENIIEETEDNQEELVAKLIYNFKDKEVFTPRPLDIDNEASLLALYRLDGNSKDQTGMFPIAEISGNITNQTTGPSSLFNGSMFTNGSDKSKNWLWVDINHPPPFRHRVVDEKESEDSEFSFTFWLALNETIGQKVEDDFIFYTKGSEGWFRVYLKGEKSTSSIMEWVIRMDQSEPSRTALNFLDYCSPNEWCHWGATFDNSSDIVKIFHNGMNVVNITGVDDMDGRAGGQERTSQCRGMSFLSMKKFGRNAAGGMTDFAWFNRTLTDKEVSNVYRYGKLEVE